ncbi:MAG: molybdopterin-binding protein [Thermodesulfovibrionales bacterium]|jgi:molybdopterin biosynthesis enzyme
MCNISHEHRTPSAKKIAVKAAIGTVLAQDITEIQPGKVKRTAFKRGHIIREEDVCHLQRLGKENLFVLNLSNDEMHEDEAAYALANALMGHGVCIHGEPREGKITIIAETDGLLKINREALLAFNMLGDVMCATLHNNTVVKKGQMVAGTRAIPLIVKKDVVRLAVRIAEQYGEVIHIKGIKKPKAGVVITGNEVFYGVIKDAFAQVITEKIEAIGGEIVGTYYAPDDESFITSRLRELMNAGADILITTGGMSVDPDDVTRFAIRNLGASDIVYGSAVLPGAMFLVAYVERESSVSDSEASGPGPPIPIPILGIPACGIYATTTIFDLILPRVLAGERIDRKQLAELGHGGLCMKCETCKYPVCPFGK